MSSHTDPDEAGRRRALSQMQRLMITAEGQTDAGAAVTVLFPFYIGVVRPPPLPQGVAGPVEPERVVMVNPLPQSMVVLPAGVMSQAGAEAMEGEQEGDEADGPTGLFDPFAAIVREVMRMSAMEDRPGPPPASKASIEALKSVEPHEMLVSKAAAVAANGQECAICLEELVRVAPESVAKQTTEEEKGEDGATTEGQQENEVSTATSTFVAVKEMPCGHRYHGDCIEKWLGVHGSCPVCRYKMPEEERQAPKKSTDDVPADLPDIPRGVVWVTTTFGFPAAAEDSRQQQAQ